MGNKNQGINKQIGVSIYEPIPNDSFIGQGIVMVVRRLILKGEYRSLSRFSVIGKNICIFQSSFSFPIIIRSYNNVYKHSLMAESQWVHTRYLA